MVQVCGGLSLRAESIEETAIGDERWQQCFEHDRSIKVKIVGKILIGEDRLTQPCSELVTTIHGRIDGSVGSHWQVSDS
jgi:hypothetical protein